MDSSTLAKSLQKHLKDTGHEMSLGHVYELLSKLSGHPSWNVAKTKGEFKPLLSNLRPQEVGSGNFRVTVTTEVGSSSDNIELRKDYLVSASSEVEAEKAVSSYLSYRADDEKVELLKIPGVQELMNSEDEDQFKKSNWEVIWNDSKPLVRAGSAYSLTPQSKKISSKSREPVFTITSLSSKAIEDISAIADSVIIESMKSNDMDLPKKFIETSAALGSARVANSEGALILNSNQLTSILDTVGGYYTAVNFSAEKGRLKDKSSLSQTASLLSVAMEAKNEAESQGYIYPNKDPKAPFSLLKNDPQ